MVEEFLDELKEEWRVVRGYEGHYEVSNYGRVLSHNWHNKGITDYLHPCLDNNGYVIFTLYGHGQQRSYRAHYLVADAFLNIDDLPYIEVDHIDTNRQNNRVDNLRIVDHDENMTNPLTLLHLGRTSWARRVVNESTGEIYNSAIEASRALGKSKNAVRMAITTRTKCAGTYWRYID